MNIPNHVERRLLFQHQHLWEGGRQTDRQTTDRKTDSGDGQTDNECRQRQTDDRQTDRQPADIQTINTDR